MEPWSAHLLYQEVSKKLDIDTALSIQQYTNSLRNKNLPVIFSLGHLAKITGIGYKFLHESVSRKRESANYQLFSIHKRSGGRRFIHAVNGKLFDLQQYINDEILQKVQPHPNSYAFHSSGGIKKCAAMHCCCKWLIQFDLKDFFYSITEPMVFNIFSAIGYKSLLAFELARLCTTLRLPKTNNHYIKRNQSFVNTLSSSYEGKPFPYFLQPNLGILPQGAPTSPMLSNLAAIDLDKSLFRYSQENGFVYTRYADDITLSASSLPQKKTIGNLRFEVTSLIRKYGFRENQTKFHIAGPGARKMVLGLLVDGESPRLIKQVRNRIDRNIYSIEKYGIKAVTEHDGFKSVYGFINHISGLMAYIHYVDIQFWNKLNPRFRKIVEEI